MFTPVCIHPVALEAQEEMFLLQNLRRRSARQLIPFRLERLFDVHRSKDQALRIRELRLSNLGSVFRMRPGFIVSPKQASI